MKTETYERFEKLMYENRNKVKKRTVAKIVLD